MDKKERFEGVGLYASVPLLSAEGESLASKALAGEPILLFPFGSHHRQDWFGDVRVFDVTEEVVDAAVANFARREEIGIRQRNIPVNEGHNQRGPARGWFTDVIRMDGGLGASFRWNKKGREALEGDEWGYLSLEFAWAMTDRETGEEVNNQVIGAGLTNYPFFGQDAALHNRTTNLEGGTEMPGNGENGNSDRTWFEQQLAALGDQFAALLAREGDGGQDGGVDVTATVESAVATLRDEFSAQIQTLTAQRDAAVAQVETLSTRVETVEEARSQERYAVLAEGFAYLPRSEEFAAHLRWLHEAPDGEAHVAYFMDLLGRANKEFERAFQRQSARNVGMGDATTIVETRVAAYMQEHAGVTYRDAVSAVLQADATLNEAWQREQATTG